MISGFATINQTPGTRIGMGNCTGRYVTFQIAEAAINKKLFAEIIVSDQTIAMLFCLTTPLLGLIQSICISQMKYYAVYLTYTQQNVSISMQKILAK